MSNKRVYTVSDFPAFPHTILVVADSRQEAKGMIEDKLVRSGYHLMYNSVPQPYTIREHDLANSYISILEPA